MPRSSHIFGERLTPADVEELVDHLHRTESLINAGFPHGQSCRPDILANLNQRPIDPSADGNGLVPLTRLYRYLTCSDVFHRCMQTEWVDTVEEAEIVAALQRRLRQRVSGFGICIEVNPTSNLLIGDLADLQHHPLWRLHPPEPNPDNPPLPICIGSDDPLTFATNLRHEYALSHDALILAGQSHDQATQWIDRVRENGLRYRFTLQRGSADDWTTPIRELNLALLDQTEVRMP